MTSIKEEKKQTTEGPCPVPYGVILEQELSPALGCTEPIAVALAVASAKEALGGFVERISLSVSGNVLKNAMGVGIPGTSMVGLEMAAALAAVCGNPAYSLEVLRDMTEDDIASARELLDTGKVAVALETTDKKLYIRAECMGGGEQSTAVIEDSHTNLVHLSRNGEALPLSRQVEAEAAASGGAPDMSLDGIFAYAVSEPVERLFFLRRAIEMNERIAEAGLSGEYGAGIGKSLMDTPGKRGGLDPAALAAARAAAASEARMTGCPLPVMSAAGSGNQGLTAVVPVTTIARCLEADEEQTLRAVALSLLVTVHIKRHIGKLSAICGCAIAASVGASCGIVLLQGGSLPQVEYAVINMVADISGMICDGAKAGCALKIATAVSGAVQCAQLAMDGVVISHRDGIICQCAEETIRNLGRLAREGMEHTDRVILDMMMCK